MVRIGYKIPLISKPFQSKIPTNPKVKPEAHQVLLDEAEGLLKKGSIMISEISLSAVILQFPSPEVISGAKY